MKATDFKPCAICGKGVMHAGVPLFYRVKLESMGIDVNAVQRHAGLELMLGGGHAGAALANVMGPGDDLAKPIVEGETVLICQPCAMEPHPLMVLSDRGG